MRPELQAEVDCLKAILEANGSALTPAPLASPDLLARYERKMGVTLDQDLRSLWLFSNGSANETWFACVTDAAVQPYTFCSLDEIMDVWPDGSVAGEPDFEPEDVANADPRIQNRYAEHPGWIPFADFSNGNSTVYFDTAPSPQGHYGQIIAYQHDPDKMHYMADSFLEFFRQSNALMESPEGDFLRE